MKSARISRVSPMENFTKDENRRAQAITLVWKRGFADDVYELMTCLDTEVISPEIKAMIKQNDSLGADNGNESQSALMPNNEPHNSSVTTNRSSGCMVGGEE
jgi:hypothetical protein